MPVSDEEARLREIEYRIEALMRYIAQLEERLRQASTQLAMARPNIGAN